MMREAVREEVNGYQMYEARRAEYATADTIPFHVADEPLTLSSEQYGDMQRLCGEVAAFVEAADTLYRTDEEAASLLNRGKAEIFLRERDSEHVFIRPDLIITEDGFAVCEIETSPFGLGLAHALNNAYRGQGHETITNGELDDHIGAVLPGSGTVVYSQRTAAYRGQLGYLAGRLFSAGGRDWKVRSAEEIATSEEPGRAPRNIYRAFYLQEYDTDSSVRDVVESGENDGSDWKPSLTPHLEEKALMAFLWDDRWENYFRTELGDAGYEYLQTVIPQTWIVGEESHFLPGMPGNALDSEGIANLPRSGRAFVLKSSGYDSHGSWAESVEMLHQKSRDKAAELLVQASMRDDGLQIIQAFRQGRKLLMPFTEQGVASNSNVRVRLTPYVDPRTGNIIAAKATGRSGTDLIHASSDSVNSAVRAV